jgi:hypothetical protein
MCSPKFRISKIAVCQFLITVLIREFTSFTANLEEKSISVSINADGQTANADQPWWYIKILSIALLLGCVSWRKRNENSK